MKQIRNSTAIIILFFVLAFGLAGCSRSANVEEELPAEETPAPRLLYRTRTAEIATGEEAVLFQQACEDQGFLALINRKTGENIPADLLEDKDFVNDGRYDVYESALFRVTEKGKREKIRRYRTMAAPEDTEDRKEYYSEARPRAFRLMNNGNLFSLESSYESWQDPTQNPMQQTKNRYFVRLLQPNGTEISCHEIQIKPEQGVPDCSRVQIVGDAMAAVPQGNSVFFFNTEGVSCFSVTTPFPIEELCWLGEDRLAVILSQDSSLWISLIDTAMRTAAVPIELPQGAHGFCRGEDRDSICFLRNTEAFSLNLEDGDIRKLTSLLSVGVNPSEVSVFFARGDGSLHFVQHVWQADQTTGERYTVAEPYIFSSEEGARTDAEDNSAAEQSESLGAADEKREITVSFLRLSDSLTREMIDFNTDSTSCVLLPLDYANLSVESFLADEHQLVVMDEALFEQLRDEHKLSNLRPLLDGDPDFDEQMFFPSVVQSLSDAGGTLCALAPAFRIETMAADHDAVGGRNRLSFSDLRNLAAELPPDGSLYEPYYTADRLLRDLRKVNRNAEGLDETMSGFSRLQPPSYNYREHIADTSGMESRIYDGRLLLLQAKIGTLEELKWYDAFFPSGECCFVGWPKLSGSASILRFDELLGFGSGLDTDVRMLAWQFLRSVLREENSEDRYGFPVLREALDRIMDEDAANKVWLRDEKGRWKLNGEGERIEAARDSWYSPEWRRHYEYALTDEQCTKLLDMIENAV
jgi:hypothetical protein